MLGDDNLSYAVKVIVVVVLIDLVVLRTVNEAYDIGILLNGTGLTQVTKLRALALITLTALNATVKL